MEDFFEMPTPCKCCGAIFDLHDGKESKRWYPNITICPECSEVERDEIKAEE